MGAGRDQDDADDRQLRHGDRQSDAVLGASCTWEIENWGGGWIYSPDYYPSGEVLFQTGAGSNSGSYSDPTDDKLIKETDFGDATPRGLRELPRQEPAGRLAAEQAYEHHRDAEQPRTA